MSQDELEQEHLAQANRHIAEGEVRIRRQKSLIEKLAADGYDTTDAETLLVVLTDALAAMRDHRQKILEALGSTL